MTMYPPTIGAHVRSTLVITTLLASACVAPLSFAQETTLLLDDFRSAEGSAVGTSWTAFTDRVMGGVSRGEAYLLEGEGPRRLRLQGDVSLENNGGFVQVALPLAPQGRTLDAGSYAGVRLRVRGNGERYAVHLRTDDCRLPWQYYEASFSTDETWAEIELPFTAFRGASLSAPLDPTRLRRVALVASKKAMRAEVELARIELYR